MAHHTTSLSLWKNARPNEPIYRIYLHLSINFSQRPLVSSDFIQYTHAHVREMDGDCG